VLVTGFGLAAATWAVAMAVSPLFQLRLVVRRGPSAGVSVGYMLVLLVGFALWVGYGIVSRDVPLIVPNTIAFVVMSFTIAAVLRYR
jgi:MtN3 and saliva related transmembrane protein